MVVVPMIIQTRFYITVTKKREKDQDIMDRYLQLTSPTLCVVSMHTYLPDVDMVWMIGPTIILE